MVFVLERDPTDLADEFDEQGWVVLSGFVPPAAVAGLTGAMEDLQDQLRAGALDAWHAGDVYTSVTPGERAPHPHYVLDVARLCPAVDEVFHAPGLLGVARCIFGGVEPWEFGPEHGDRFGVVYQDARPGEDMTYTRIGWHTDRQAYPTSSFHPSVAITVHLDGTSPANGFLRVVPGSHRSDTSGMPAGFDKVPGEVGLYCNPGDVLLHHGDLWHAAARATEDPPDGVRRHLRGSLFAGRRPEPGEPIEAFNKNAAR